MNAHHIKTENTSGPLVLGRHYYRIHVITIRVIYLTSQKIHVDQRLFVPIKFMFYKNYCYIT